MRIFFAADSCELCSLWSGDKNIQGVDTSAALCTSFLQQPASQRKVVYTPNLLTTLLACCSIVDHVLQRTEIEKFQLAKTLRCNALGVSTPLCWFARIVRGLHFADSNDGCVTVIPLCMCGC